MPGVGTAITGLAVQKTGPYLFVARRDVNRLDVLDKTTGALRSTRAHSMRPARSPSMATTFPVDGEEHNPGLLGYSVAPDGTLTLVANTFRALEAARAPTSPVERRLPSQMEARSRVMGFSTRSYTWQWELGQAGRLRNGPSVENDKFFFETPSARTGRWRTLRISPTAEELWVGDIGNSRTLRLILRVCSTPVSSMCPASTARGRPERQHASVREFPRVQHRLFETAGRGQWLLDARAELGVERGGSLCGRSFSGRPAKYHDTAGIRPDLRH